MNILLIGAPGVGKGTISRYLIENYGMKHISTGDILRKAVSEKTTLGLKVKEYMDEGILVPDSIIIKLINETLNNGDVDSNYIFDGFPRTITQAKEFENILNDLNLKIDIVIALDVKDDVVINRITGRRVCSKCNTIYNIYYKAPKRENICDLCGGELYIRKDDNLDSLKKRLSEYHINSESLLSFYKEKGIVRVIDASTSREKEYEVLEEILREVK